MVLVTRSSWTLHVSKEEKAFKMVANNLYSIVYASTVYASVISWPPRIKNSISCHHTHDRATTISCQILCKVLVNVVWFKQKVEAYQSQWECRYMTPSLWPSRNFWLFAKSVASSWAIDSILLAVLIIVLLQVYLSSSLCVCVWVYWLCLAVEPYLYLWSHYSNLTNQQYR